MTPNDTKRVPPSDAVFRTQERSAEGEREIKLQPSCKLSGMAKNAHSVTILESNIVDPTRLTHTAEVIHRANSSMPSWHCMIFVDSVNSEVQRALSRPKMKVNTIIKTASTVVINVPTKLYHHMPHIRQMQEECQ